MLAPISCAIAPVASIAATLAPARAFFICILPVWCRLTGFTSRVPSGTVFATALRRGLQSAPGSRSTFRPSREPGWCLPRVHSFAEAVKNILQPVATLLTPARSVGTTFKRKFAGLVFLCRGSAPGQAPAHLDRGHDKTRVRRRQFCTQHLHGTRAVHRQSSGLVQFNPHHRRRRNECASSRAWSGEATMATRYSRARSRRSLSRSSGARPTRTKR